MTIINNLLEKLGFNTKESEVYLAILKQGKVTHAEVAKITGINRTTVYSIAKELAAKGVVTEDLGSPKTSLLALPPQDLENIIFKEEKKLANKKIALNKAIDELKLFSEEVKYSIPRLVFITEENIEKHLYKQTARWNNSALEIDKIWWGFQDPSFVVNYEKWLDWSWQEKSAEQIYVQLLSSKSNIEDKMAQKGYERRKIKFWEKSESFTATTWVIGNYIVMLGTNTKPFYLIEIYDSAMSANLREIFKAIWQTV